MGRPLRWYFDVVSPYVYLQAESMQCLPEDAEVHPIPVLFAGLLRHWDNLGPAEIPAKRRQTYRYSHWLAHRRGIPFKAPPRHPFNPLAFLRLAVAIDADMDTVRVMLRHVWGEGNDGQDPESIGALAQRLGVRDAPALIDAADVKERLRRNTEEAIARGVFGIPTFDVDGELFWGDDVTGMMLDYLADPTLFSRGELARLGDLPVAATRKESRL